MSEKIKASSRQHPCQICGRTKDGDCRELLESGRWLCHGNTDLKPGQVIQGQDGRSWAFTGVAADQRCGVFKVDEPLPELPAPIQPIAPPSEPSWPYSATQRVRRHSKPDGEKTFSPEHFNGQSWARGKGPDPWPLYGAPIQGQTVIEVEGEKCVDVLRAQGINAITQPGHNHTEVDCTRRYSEIKHITTGIIYIADNDETGRSKGLKLQRCAANAGVPFTLLHAEHLFAGMPEGGSVDDVTDPTTIRQAISDGLTRRPPAAAAPAIDQARVRLKQLIADGLSGSSLAAKVVEFANEYNTPPAALFRLAESLQSEEDSQIAADADYEQIKHEAVLKAARAGFRLEHVLPEQACEPLRYFSSTLQSDDLSTAMIFLTCISGAIRSGTRVWGDAMSFSERPQLWLGLVGKSGLGKSPAAKRLGINNMRSVVRHYQQLNVTRHNEWERVAMDIANKKDRPPAPAPFMFRIGSYTKAAIVKQFMANEEDRLGMLIFNDELKSLFCSLNQFQANGKGAEEEQLLELFDNDGDSEIRAGDGHRHYEEAQLSIIGGIQPEVYSRLASAGDSNGLFARLLLIPLPKEYSGDNEPEYASMELTHRMDSELNNIALRICGLKPTAYHLTPEARAAHKIMRRDAFSLASDSFIPAHSNIYGKRAGYILRLAGVMHILKIACNEIPEGSPIPLDTLLIARDVIHHVQEYSLTAQTQAAQHSAGVVPDMMRRLHKYGLSKGTPISAGMFRNTLTPSQRKENSLQVINTYVEKLVELGYAVYQGDGSANGGRRFTPVGLLPG